MERDLAPDDFVWRNGVDTTYTLADCNIWRVHFGQAFEAVPHEQRVFRTNNFSMP